tara:strand:- start:35 stop:589 length:555 start_codon:yes stop_codon:yes gene_type:complete
MICLWDKLPDEIQTKILHLKKKAEIKDKDLFWYEFGERMKNIRHSNSHIMCTMCKRKYEQKPHSIVSGVIRELRSTLEEIMFKDYPIKLTNRSDWTVKDRGPLEIFYGEDPYRNYTEKDLSPAELVEELISIQIHYDTFVRGTVNTGTMVYNGRTRKWVNNHYEKKIDASFEKINKLIFGTKFI